jgi:signal transduction histidine kinase
MNDFPTYAGRPLNDFIFEGDTIRAVVDTIVEHSSEIFLSVKFLREQTQTEGHLNEVMPRATDSNAQLQALWNRLGNTEERFSELKEYGSAHTVAVVCNDEKLGFALVCLLKGVGFTASECAFPHELQAVHTDLILLDVDRALARNSLQDEIRLWTAASHGARLVLLYSDTPSEYLRQLRDASNLYQGAIRKWFKPKQLLSSIRAALNDRWQFDENQLPDGNVWREMAMQEAVDHERNRDEALSMILHQLQIGLGATAVVLVHFNCATRQTSLLSAIGVRREDFDTARCYLDKSPVRDIVEDHECYLVSDANWEEATFRHLYKLLPSSQGRPSFRSFLGMRLVDFGRGFVQTEGRDRKTTISAPTSDIGRENYALLAFHTERQAFLTSGVQLFCRSAVLILAVIERASMRRELTKFSEQVLVARQASFLLHEFRTRTTAVQIWNRLLEGDIEKLQAKRVPSQEQIDQLRATSSSLNQVANGLSHINELFLNLSIEGQRAFRLGSLIGELKQVFREQMRNLSVLFKLDLVWDGELVSNRGHVTHILSNLIQNALDQFQLADCKRPEIRVKVEKSEPIDKRLSTSKIVRVIVEDNGIGIPCLNFGKIFEYNFTTKPDGSGIGLHVSRLIAENLRGSLVLEASERFFQTRFVITLPV